MRGCGLKSQEKDCDASDRAGTDFDDGICACDKDLCNKHIPGKKLACYYCNSITSCNTMSTIRTCTTSQNACLTKNQGLENFRCCQTKATFDTELEAIPQSDLT